MIIAKSEKLDHIFTGPELRTGVQDRGSLFLENLTCPVCGKDLVYSDSSIETPFEFFHHSDGSSDCFETDSTSDEHRLMAEVTMKSLHNRIREVSGEPVEIDIEKWVGIRNNFVIADVRVVSPIQVAAELFYKSETLSLGRRFDTLFSNNYRAYLIFHRDGLHDVNRVERYLRQVAPLRVGRFDHQTLDLTLGDLFTSDRFNLTASNREGLPNYIVR
jgi:hypothetical protein